MYLIPKQQDTPKRIFISTTSSLWNYIYPFLPSLQRSHLVGGFWMLADRCGSRLTWRATCGRSWRHAVWTDTGHSYFSYHGDYKKKKVKYSLLNQMLLKKLGFYVSQWGIFSNKVIWREYSELHKNNIFFKTSRSGKKCHR